MLVQDLKPRKKTALFNTSTDQINVPMSCKQRQKSMHTCQLYTYTNNTSVNLNKTLRARNRERKEHWSPKHEDIL